MGGTPQQITIDPSTIMPLGPSSLSRAGGSVPASSSLASVAPQPDFSNVQIDPSTISPIGGHARTQTTEQPGIGERVWNAGKQELGNLASGAASIGKAVVSPPEDATEHAIASIGGPGGLIAYRTSKGVVDAVENMVKSKKESFKQAQVDMVHAINEFHKKDYRNALSDTGSVVADFGGMSGDPLATMGREREIAQGTKAGGDLATPLTKDVVDLGAAAALERVGGKLTKGTGATEGAETAGAVEEANPITSAQDRAISKISAKANIPEGRAATERIPKTPETTNASEAPTAKSTSPETQRAIREHAEQIATQENLESPKPETPIREVYQNLGFKFLDRAQAKYAEVMEKTGVDITKETSDLRTLSDKISDLSGDTDDAVNMERAGKLQQQKLAKESRVQKAFDAIPDASQAKADWMKGNAALDMNSHVVNSTIGRAGIGSGEVTDATKLAPRLEKDALPQSRTQPGRLQQLGGDTHAKNLLDATETQRSAIKDFAPKVTPGTPEIDALPATDKQALREIIKPSAGKVYGINDNWGEALKKFDSLSDAEQAARFKNPAAVRQALRNQATKQNVLTGVKGVLGLGTLAAAEETIRRMFF